MSFRYAKSRSRRVARFDREDLAAVVLLAALEVAAVAISGTSLALMLFS